MIRAKLVLWVGVIAGLTGCMVGPNYHAPAVAMPDAWTTVATKGDPVDGAWWESFHDPILDRLVAQARAANTDLRVAVARLREARAQRGVVTAALWPRVDAEGSFSNSRFSENGFLKGLGGPSDGGLPGAIVPGQQINLWQADIDASWELDLFGRNRRAIEAANADISAAEYDLDDALVAVSAEVADAYTQLRGVQARLALARRTLASEQDTLSVVQEQWHAGVAGDLDLSRAKAQVGTTAARVPELEGAEQAAVRRLEVLVGAMPGTLDKELLTTTGLPAAPEALNAGIPSQTLRRRADVRAAERRLGAASARIGVATAELFPQFSLTGTFGLQSQKIGDLPEGDSRFWALGPSVRWPILDFGRIRANIAVQNARTQAALATYEGTVLQALSDVEVALVRLSRERARADQLHAAAESARQSTRTARELYRGGLLEFLDLLDVQRTQFAAEDASVQSDAAIVSDTVALYRALGGGWQKRASAPSTQAQ